MQVTKILIRIISSSSLNELRKRTKNLNTICKNIEICVDKEYVSYSKLHMIHHDILKAFNIST
jgi:hypothetical protein